MQNFLFCCNQKPTENPKKLCKNKNLYKFEPMPRSFAAVVQI